MIKINFCLLQQPKVGPKLLGGKIMLYVWKEKGILNFPNAQNTCWMIIVWKRFKSLVILILISYYKDKNPHMDGHFDETYQLS